MDLVLLLVNMVIVAPFLTRVVVMGLDKWNCNRKGRIMRRVVYTTCCGYLLVFGLILVLAGRIR